MSISSVPQAASNRVSSRPVEINNNLLGDVVASHGVERSRYLLPLIPVYHRTWTWTDRFFYRAASMAPVCYLAMAGVSLSDHSVLQSRNTRVSSKSSPIPGDNLDQDMAQPSVQERWRSLPNCPYWRDCMTQPSWPTVRYIHGGISGCRMSDWVSLGTTLPCASASAALNQAAMTLRAMPSFSVRGQPLTASPAPNARPPAHVKPVACANCSQIARAKSLCSASGKPLLQMVTSC